MQHIAWVHQWQLCNGIQSTTQEANSMSSYNTIARRTDLSYVDTNHTKSANPTNSSSFVSSSSTTCTKLCFCWQTYNQTSGQVILTKGHLGGGSPTPLIKIVLMPFSAKWKHLATTPKQSPTFALLCDQADERLFFKVRYNNTHLIHCLLPLKVNKTHKTRPCSHPFQLPTKTTSLDECNFICRMLYKCI